MTKHKRTKRRNQRGGAWYNPMSWFSGTGTEDPDAPKKSIVDTITGATTNAVNSANTLVGDAANSVTQGASNISDSISSTLNTNVDVTGTQQPTGTQSTGTQSTDVQSQPVPVPMGGKKRRRSRTMKGGKGGLGLTYYASPVSGIKVAQPTTWLNYSTKGGSRRRRTNKRKTHRHKKY
jgi:hypothetical protein